MGRFTARGVIAAREQVPWHQLRRDVDTARFLQQAKLKDLSDVVTALHEVDQRLHGDDGLVSFHRAHRRVVEAVAEGCGSGRYEKPGFLERLVVDHARLSFEALVAHVEAPDRAPRAWQPLFRARFHEKVVPAQHGLAGMAAHLVRDLPVALARAVGPGGLVAGSAEHADYRGLDRLWRDAEVDALRLTSSGLLALAERALGSLDDAVGLAVVHGARDVAWTNARLIARLPARAGGVVVGALDRAAAVVGRAFLTRTVL